MRRAIGTAADAVGLYNLRYRSARRPRQRDRSVDVKIVAVHLEYSGAEKAAAAGCCNPDVGRQGT
jgi:hypothetical protein